VVIGLSKYKVSTKRSEPEFLNILRSPGINSKKSIPPAYIAWRAGTTTLFQIGSSAHTDFSEIPAQNGSYWYELDKGKVYRRNQGGVGVSWGGECTVTMYV
jgi:hypothetical protein